MMLAPSPPPPPPLTRAAARQAVGLVALPSPAHADVLRVCTERGLGYAHASFTCYAHGSADGAPSLS